MSDIEKLLGEFLDVRIESLGLSLHRAILRLVKGSDKRSLSSIELFAQLQIACLRVPRFGCPQRSDKQERCSQRRQAGSHSSSNLEAARARDAPRARPFKNGPCRGDKTQREQDRGPSHARVRIRTSPDRGL